MTIRFSRLAIALAFTLCASVAHAQGVMQSSQGLQQLGHDTSLGIAFLPQKANLGQMGGVKLSESSVLHAGVGLEAGYDTNVFFQNNNRVAAPVLRVVPFLELTNGERGGAMPTGLYYDLTATLLYREFLTDDDNAKQQRAFNPVLSALVDFNPNAPLNVSLTDQFARFEEPPYGAGTGNITRIYNMAGLQLSYAPGGGRLQMMLRYSNMVNVFETEALKYANHMGHDLTLDLSWRWLPKTSLFVQASQGYIDYFNPDEAPANLARQDSYPLRTLLGLRGLITNKLNLYLGVGYLNGFYTGGVQNPSGLSNLGAVAELSYAPTPLTKIMVGYRREFRNSPVIANFFDVDSPYVSFSANVATRMMLTAFARYEARRYRGSIVPGAEERKDNVVQAGAQADLFVANWFFLGASYIATVNDSNYQELFPNAAGFDYTKHLVLARLGVTY